MREPPRQILPDLWQFQDSCNVYVIKSSDRAIAIDFGMGEWLQHLPDLGIQHLEHVFLTHHHADQCAGLQAQADWPFTIHAPAGEGQFLSPEAQARGTFDRRAKGCPDSYAVLRGGIANVRYDTMAGFTDFFWGELRIRFVHSPGHGPFACSVIVDHAGRQVVFCGDAAHAGGTMWLPYHLEWDHWTGKGVLAAWEGVIRLLGISVDVLCPAHGPIITETQPARATLKVLSERLLKFYLSKGQISPAENDDYLTPETLHCGARKVSPNLYHFGTNGYLLTSTTDAGLVVDPFMGDMPALEALLTELGQVHLTAAVVTHYHLDHCDAVPTLQQRYGAKATLHPLVMEPLVAQQRMQIPWLPREAIIADDVWPINGNWGWNEYVFRVAPWPGQTRWHCIFMTSIGGQKVAFGGDSFQPSSRWNGTGGYCAYNGSRFEEGFIPSAQLLLEWQPDLLACGHGAYYRFHAAKFRKIMRWARSAQRAVVTLCPNGNLEQDYYLVNMAGNTQIHEQGEPFWAIAA